MRPPPPGEGTHGADQAVTVLVRQAEVAHQHVGHGVRDARERLLRGLDADHLRAVRLEDDLEALQEIGVVVHEEHADPAEADHARPRPENRRLRHRGGRLRDRDPGRNHGDGEQDGEAGAAADAAALRAHGASVELHEIVDEREAEPQAADGARHGGVGLAEAVEHEGQERGVDPQPRVLDHELHRGGSAAEPHPDRAFRIGELHRVRQQVPGDLLQAAGIAVDHRLAVEAHLEGDALAQSGRPDGLDRRFHDGSELHPAGLDAELARDHPAHVEDVRDEAGLRLGVALDRVERALHHDGVQARRAQHVGPAHDRVEGRPQLVGERGQELVLDAVRLPQGLLRGARAQQGADGGDEDDRLGGMSEIRVRPRVERFRPVLRARVGGGHLEDGDGRSRRVRLEPPRDLEAVDVGKLHVEHDDVGHVRVHAAEGLLARARLLHAEARLMQGARHRVPRELVVVDDEDHAGGGSLALGRHVA